MVLKKISQKASIGAHIVKEQGLLELSIRSLRFIQKKRRKSFQQPSSTTATAVASNKTSINVKALYEDVLHADISRASEHVKRAHAVNRGNGPYTFNWLMPPPGKGSGGHMNIFRFLEFLEKAGHRCNIYLYLQGASGSTAHVKALMGDSYPPLDATDRMKWLEPNMQMEPADGIFATSWETAYPVFNDTSSARKFYFVQDFEPYFYPVGSMYALAENTYRFKFFGVTAGGWLANKLKTEYGMDTAHFDFGSDQDLYHFTNDAPRKEVFFYARPYTERRGFESGIMALDLFHRKHPEYTINLAGWDVSDYDIPFPYNNLKTLELSELNELYNRCALGLILSFTNMSLLPLELMAGGAIPVVNDAPNNRMVSDNPFIAYCPADPVSLAKQMSEIVSKPNLTEYAKQAADSVTNTSWEQSGKKFISILEQEMRNRG